MKTNSYETIDELDIYFKEINKYKPLSRTKEAELAKRIRRGDENALNALIRSNLRFVVSVAKKYRSSGVPFHDLISEGNIGLMKAAQKFDETRGTKFISYAVWWVKSAIQEHIQTVTKGDEYYTDEYNTIMCRDSEFEYNPNVIDEEFEVNIVNRASRTEALSDLMKDLSEREAKVILMYYGIGRKDICTLDDIGQELKITKERVRQIRDAALTKMKVEALSNDEFDTYKSMR